MIHIDKDTQQFILKHESDDIRQLALKAKSYPGIDMSIAIKQIAGRQIAKHKIPSWYQCENIIYPKHLSMEQCSSEATALYKAALCKGDILIDLTGGLGVDFSFMAKNYKQAYYIETQHELTELAQCNFNTLNLNQSKVIQDDAVSFLNSFDGIADTIFIDPARRNDTGKKTVLIEDCTPNLLEIDNLLNTKAQRVIIKLSPMLDITHALNSLSNVTEVHIISVNNECKELLFIKDKVRKDEDIQLICINLLTNKKDESFTFIKAEENTSSISHTDEPKRYLYEPNSSILKAGAYRSLGARYGLMKLHPNSHLYTSDTLIDSFPGRKFQIKEVISPNKKEIKAHFKDITQANIATRNYPFSVADIRKQTKLKEGGTDYIFATTLANEKKVLILCQKVSD
ncbi:SAM-dependent methyltransferase [Dysgonomonas sp. HDW5B]|uniref:THUMP-like domain-containing protein n=1 Tax=Dysgonomonas sp. HDW5B TaxID=2714927 RepID=UPI00140E0580|nr:class I SAM-dependent methyltransferase [Dysgonomonas sp. HDW5B]QIK55601.1 SAM-dependent methyltransferase [Dysgonomonas sp. HDW5B]